MFGGRKAPKRFSLLLLEEGEDYVDDWVASVAWPPAVSGNWQSSPKLPGRLRLCSKSIFFEPDDVRIPIVRLPMAQAQHMEPEGKQSFAMTTSLVVKMRANMADAPYTFEKGAVTNWRFSLAYAQLSAFMPLAHQYLAASRLPYAEREEALQVLAQQLIDAAAFDTSRLVDFTESMQYNGAAMQLTPLVREAGCLAVTSLRIYFQPLHNVTSDSPVRVFALSDVAAMARRRSSLKPTGLELFFVDTAGPSAAIRTPSVFFAFRSELDRDRAAAAIAQQPSLGSSLLGGRDLASACGSILEADGQWLQRVTAAWQQGKLSNLDYLLFCNLAAGRSFNDLTQWPVFPWILADYTSTKLDLSMPETYRDLSKPVGALNEARLRLFQERFREMPQGEGMDAPFMYGSHYSCPGYVMFWLVRAAPGHLLRLQGGRFDAPDRMFCSIREAWDSVTSSTADVKELIPEFFLSDASFLMNLDHLALGKRQNGKLVGDVELPGWAQSPAHFLQTHRAALEGPFVSANLHHWIDLIFGYKQQGEASVEADNVFHHATYGAVQSSWLSSKHEQAALEVQINEFGQCPRQIFHAPHPPRLVCPDIPKAGEGARAGAGSPSKYARKMGAEVGSELSLALLTTIREAVASRAGSAPSLNVSDELARLDVLANKQKQATVLAPNREADDTLQEAASAAKGRTMNADLPAADGQAQVNGSGRLRAWSGKLGSQISTLKSRVGPNADQVTSTLRGLFQRQGSQDGQRPLSPPPSRPVHDHDAEPDRAQSSPSEILQCAAGVVSAGTEPGADSAVQSRASRDSAVTVSTGSQLGGHDNSSILSEASSAVKLPATASSDSLPTATRPGLFSDSDWGQDSSASQSAQSRGEPGYREGGNAQQAPWPPVTASPGKAADPVEGPVWPLGLRHRLPNAPTHSILAQQGPVHAVGLAQTGEGRLAYCLGHTGTLKIFNAASGSQVRAAKLTDMPCTAMALLSNAAGGSSGQPIVLCGSYDNKVYATQHGRALGAFDAHDDAVSCLATCAAPDSIISASWDCSVKLWSVAEGREPWGGTPVLPSLEIGDHEAGIWALSADGQGRTLVTGTEDGSVAAWDLRSRACIWQAAVSQDYIGGLSLSSAEQAVVVAAADGSASLLDMRRGGAEVSRAACGAPLHCVASDGRVALLGREDGQVLVWDLKQQQGARASSGDGAAPGPDGLYAPLYAGTSAVNSVCLSTDSQRVVVGLESGHLSLFAVS
ncbi:hypothetical protein CVIRNUC_002763 [Coccomyxa viridis]|uniref:Uncharacterized protein n=1 Tax=Coccomyxa viridis TaxID=1274662 RepID=A0AAV1HXR2_9CHLO|nr:hypothetical protein CVIRNUC_002763 [Coccomyxa viridis]